jgi:hypothetical protein
MSFCSISEAGDELKRSSSAKRLLPPPKATADKIVSPKKIDMANGERLNLPQNHGI